MPEISRHAIVEKTARIADDARIGSFTYIGPDVEIGPGCVIENNVTITGRTVLSANNHVYPMAVIGTPANGETDGGCLIGKANLIREHVTIYSGKQRPTRLGTDNLIMIGSEIGAAAIVGDHEIFANCTIIGAGCTVEDYVRTSGFALVEPGAAVGAYTFIAGHAVIERQAPPFAIVQGSPFRVRGVNAENLRRCGFADSDIRCLRGVFRELFKDQTDHANPDGLDALESQAAENPHVARLVQFLRKHAGAKEAGPDA